MRTIIISLIITMNLSIVAFADFPNTLNYQGRLMNPSSQPVTDGQYNVTFRLYTALSGGTMEWEEAQQVRTNNGYFNTVLGNETALTSSIFNQSLWISTQIGSEQELSSRQKLGTAAYAMTVVDGAVTTDKIKDGAITSDKISSTATIAQALTVDGWHVCAGSTGNSNWSQYQDDSLVLHVDTSSYKFPVTPTYIVNTQGNGQSLYLTTGGSTPYNVDEKGFTIFIKQFTPITPTTAVLGNWHVEWIALYKEE